MVALAACHLQVLTAMAFNWHGVLSPSDLFVTRLGPLTPPCCPSLEKFGWLAGVALEDAGALLVLDVESR